MKNPRNIASQWDTFAIEARINICLTYYQPKKRDSHPSSLRSLCYFYFIFHAMKKKDFLLVNFYYILSWKMRQSRENLFDFKVPFNVVCSNFHIFFNGLSPCFLLKQINLYHKTRKWNNNSHKIICIEQGNLPVQLKVTELWYFFFVFGLCV